MTSYPSKNDVTFLPALDSRPEFSGIHRSGDDGNVPVKLKGIFLQVFIPHDDMRAHLYNFGNLLRIFKKLDQTVVFTLRFQEDGVIEVVNNGFSQHFRHKPLEDWRSERESLSLDKYQVMAFGAGKIQEPFKSTDEKVICLQPKMTGLIYHSIERR